MNNYEHTIILRQDISNSQQNTIIEKYTKLIEKNNGKIMQTQIWGLMNLSYIIKKNRNWFEKYVEISSQSKKFVEKKINIANKTKFSSNSFDIWS